MKVIFLIGAFAVLLLAGCSSAIGKIEAEQKAIQFVNKNVKFFARQENSTLDLPRYAVESITSYQQGSNWVVAMHVSARLGNETKKNDLVVKMNRRGDVLEFNGEKIK